LRYNARDWRLFPHPSPPSKVINSDMLFPWHLLSDFLFELGFHSKICVLT
jgi:hypothetical protein